VDIWMQVDAVRLPEALQAQADEVEALYQFELLARPRGKRWYLSRRTAEEDSPACRTHAQLTRQQASGGNLVYLSTAFLANRAKVSQQDRSLAYAMDLAVRVPDYQLRKRFWPDQHFEGSHLLRDGLLISLEPPLQPGGEWRILHSWESQHVGQATQALSYQALADGGLRLELPLPSAGLTPGLDGKVVLIVSAWR
jgi:virulence-associated protein VagC